MFTNMPFAVTGSISICSWIVWGGTPGLSDMARVLACPPPERCLDGGCRTRNVETVPVEG